MRVLKKNTHVDLATGHRTDQLVGDGQTVDVYWEPLTASQLAAVREFQRTMRDEVIPEIERRRCQICGGTEEDHRKAVQKCSITHAFSPKAER
jgi:hypothetical protein